MYLIPQFRAGRRASGAAPITINQEATGTTSVVFAVAPVEGELIVIIACGTSAVTAPSGFAVAINANNDPATGRALMYTKTAGAGESATVTLTGAIVAYGARLSHGTLTFTENDGTAVSSIASGASALNPADGSVMFAACGFQGNTSAPSADNSFTVKNSGARGIIACRAYSSGASSQNCTLSWTTARNVSSFLGLFSP